MSELCGPGPMTVGEVATALDEAAAAVSPAPADGPVDGPVVVAPPDPWWVLFSASAVAIEGGHLQWVGARSGVSRTPVVALRSQVQTAGRLAFRWHHGREPQGNVTARCGFPQCVAGAHLVDQTIRRERGGVMFPGATWDRGVDLVAVERAMSRRGECPPLTDEEREYAITAMTDAGWSANEISQRLGVAAKTVERRRLDAAAGAGEAPP